jgi:hypothetical protein
LLIVPALLVAQFAPGPRRLNPINDSLVAYWTFDESSGTAFDAVGTNHLSAVNTPTAATGKIKGGRFLRATGSQYFSAPQSPELDVGFGAFTVACWFYPSNWANAEGGLVSRRNDGSPFTKDEWTTYITYSNVFFAVFSNASVIVSKTTTNKATTNAWNLLIAWRDPGKAIGMRLYSPSFLPAVTETNTDAGRIATNCPTIQIGTERASTFINSGFDDIALWKRTLTTNEMDWLWNLGHGGIGYFITPSRYTATP